MPEQKLASRLITIRGLKPPIPVQALVSELADVQFDHIPSDCDGVMIRYGLGKRRPLVVVESRAPQVRRRFTLAHELGHLLIPGHIGTLSCHVNTFNPDEEYGYQATEAEANRFAAELLLPTDWIFPIAQSNESIRSKVEAVRVADVSLPAICFKLFSLLGPGYAFAYTDGGSVRYSGSSPGTLMKAPPKGKHLDLGAVMRLADTHDVISTKLSELHLWRIRQRLELVPCDGPNTPKEIVMQIAAELGLDGKKLWAKLSSIIGAQNNTLGQPTTAEELFFKFTHRFDGLYSDEPELSEVVQHPRFSEFLAIRAKELFEKRLRLN